MTDAVRLSLITIAVSDAPRMAEFYSTLLATPFEAIDSGSFTLYIGRLAELEVQLCPKEVAGIAATQNIHQLRFKVPHLERHMAVVVAAGGRALGDVVTQGSITIAGVRDPDGNSIELCQEHVS